MWTWVQTIALRRFQEMTFTGRPFTTNEMFQCNFVNKVVPRDQLEAEFGKYARATTPMDAVLIQKCSSKSSRIIRANLGSVESALSEPAGSSIKSDGDELIVDHALEGKLADAVNDNDSKFPSDFRLSKSNRKKTD